MQGLWWGDMNEKVRALWLLEGPWCVDGTDKVRWQKLLLQQPAPTSQA